MEEQLPAGLVLNCCSCAEADPLAVLLVCPCFVSYHPLYGFGPLSFALSFLILEERGRMCV